MSEPSEDPPTTPTKPRSFVRQYRMYFLVPVIVTLLLGALMVLGSRQGAPFVYTLF